MRTRKPLETSLAAVFLTGLVACDVPPEQQPDEAPAVDSVAIMA